MHLRRWSDPHHHKPQRLRLTVFLQTVKQSRSVLVAGRKKLRALQLRTAEQSTPVALAVAAETMMFWISLSVCCKVYKMLSNKETMFARVPNGYIANNIIMAPFFEVIFSDYSQKDIPRRTPRSLILQTRFTFAIQGVVCSCITNHCPAKAIVVQL